MSTELLSVAGITSIVAIFFTLLFQYFPGLRVAWGGLASNAKKMIVLGIYVVVGAVAAFGGCVPAIANVVPALGCVGARAFLDFFVGVLIAIGAGQGVFAILPELGDVTEAKELRY